MLTAGCWHQTAFLPVLWNVRWQWSLSGNVDIWFAVDVLEHWLKARLYLFIFFQTIKISQIIK